MNADEMRMITLRRMIMKIKSKVNAGTKCNNHNQTIARRLRIKSSVRVGGSFEQHNQKVARGLRVKVA